MRGEATNQNVDFFGREAQRLLRVPANSLVEVEISNDDFVASVFVTVDVDGQSAFVGAFALIVSFEGAVRQSS